MRLFEEGFFVLDGGAEMSDAETPYPSVAGKGGCLQSCGVTGLLCPQSALMAVGGFVVKQIHAADDVLQLRKIDRVGTIGIRARGCCRGGQAFVRNDGAVLRRPRSTGFDVVYLADRNPVGINHLPSDVRQIGFLPEKIAGRRDAMLQGNAVDGDASVFINEVALAHIDGMEEDFVLNVGIVSTL